MGTATVCACHLILFMFAYLTSPPARCFSLFLCPVGKNNRHCLCETCERQGRGGYTPQTEGEGKEDDADGSESESEYSVAGEVGADEEEVNVNERRRVGVTLALYKTRTATMGRRRSLQRSQSQKGILGKNLSPLVRDGYPKAALLQKSQPSNPLSLRAGKSSVRHRPCPCPLRFLRAIPVNHPFLRQSSLLASLHVFAGQNPIQRLTVLRTNPKAV